MQRHEPLVGLVRHNLVRAHDPIAGTHDVFTGVDAAAQLVAAPLRFQRPGDQRGPEELPHELEIQHVSDTRPRVGVQLLGAVQVLRECQHLIPDHR